MIHVGKKRGISRSSGGNAMIIVFMSFLGIVMFIPLLYNGPVISDHRSKKYREHGKIQ